MIKRNSLFATDKMTKSDRCLHTPGSFAKQNLIYVQEVGTLQSIQPHKCTRENLDSYLLLLVLDGKGKLQIRGQSIEVQKGDCALIDCKGYYEHISDEQDAWKLAWIHFNGNAAKGYYELFLKYNRDQNIFHIANVDHWESLIREIREKQREKSFLSELKCGELLLHLMNCVVELVMTPVAIADERSKEQANEIRQLLNEQFAQHNIFAMLEEELAEPVSSLNELFSAAYGIGIEEYINIRRYNYAKELLRFSIKPVEEIVVESGIHDMVVLQRMFQENEGMTAEEYRMKWAQWIR